MSKAKQFSDVRLQPSFIEDWEHLPKTVQRRVDRRLLDWSITGVLPNSAQAHGAVWDGKEILIVYITCGSGSYRMFTSIENRELVCWRVFNHEDQNKALGRAKAT